MNEHRIFWANRSRFAVNRSRFAVNRSRFAALLAVVVAASLVLAACSGAKSTQTAATTTAKVIRGSLSASVGATGTVVAKQSATLNWGASGRVGELKVKVGDEVKAGDTLASLDPASYSQSMLSALNDLITAKANLQALFDGADAAKAQAMVDLLAAQDTLATAKTTLDSMNYRRGTDNMISSAEADVTLAAQQLARAQENYDRTHALAEDDPVRANAVIALNNATTNYQSKLSILNWYKNKPTAADLAEAQAAYDLAAANVAALQRKVDSLANGPSADDVTQAQNKVAIAQAAVDQALIKAPIDGTVTDLSVMQGDMVSAGDSALRIDNLTTLYVNLSVSEIDINSIAVGQTVGITFDAIADKEYKGKVTQVGTVGTTNSGSVYFNVVVELTDPDALVKPGMTASATVITAQVSDVLMVPSRALRGAKGKTVVMKVDSSGQVTPVEVTVGMTANSMTQVTSDQLAEGDTVQVTVSTTSTTTTNQRGFGGMGGGFIEGGAGGPPPGGN